MACVVRGVFLTASVWLSLSSCSRANTLQSLAAPSSFLSMSHEQRGLLVPRARQHQLLTNYNCAGNYSTTVYTYKYLYSDTNTETHTDTNTDTNTETHTNT